MGNSLDSTNDPGMPLQILCDKYPDKAKDFRKLSAQLRTKMGDEWPLGGTKDLEMVKKIQGQIWRKNQGMKAKELIGLWRQYCQEERDKIMLSSWQDNAHKMGIPISEQGNLKTLQILKKECAFKKRANRDRKDPGHTRDELRSSMAGLELTEEEKFNNLEKSVKVPSAPISWSALIPEPPEYNNIYPVIAPQISNMPETQALLGDSVGPDLPTSQPEEQKELCPTSPVSSRTRSRTAREGLDAHQKQLSISPKSPQTKEKPQDSGTKEAETTSFEEKELPLVTGRDVEVLEQPGEIARVTPW
ncbi:uncharacterized protein [Scyliorhinus torazame]|uniref:uncharacterized protein isoform X2 n=1 Tax=Scyliorhinus torazame TaxID=75743 RepID=UPI003B58F896